MKIKRAVKKIGRLGIQGWMRKGVKIMKSGFNFKVEPRYSQ